MKTLSATERHEDAHATWQERIGSPDPGRLVFIDECGAHTSMTRRAARGAQARGAVPRNRGPVPALLARMSSTVTVEGGTDTAMFATHLDHYLLPALAPGQMVVVDNVGAHKPDRIRELLEAAGCELVFVPADSPHLCPIEEAFSKLKALIRAAAARTRAALDAAIATALQAVTPADALALAIVSRVMSTAVELVCAGVAAIAARLSARRPART